MSYCPDTSFKNKQSTTILLSLVIFRRHCDVILYLFIRRSYKCRMVDFLDWNLAPTWRNKPNTITMGLLRLGTATMSQLDFFRDSDPISPWEIGHTEIYSSSSNNNNTTAQATLYRVRGGSHDTRQPRRWRDPGARCERRPPRWPVRQPGCG